MELDYRILAVVAVFILIVVFFYNRNKENFDIPFGKSSAWGWNTGPGYGAGYGTGYGLYGKWPGSDPLYPWKWYMWKRMPRYMFTPFTPVPQIDYNYAPPKSGATSNYNVSVVPGSTNFFINGQQKPTLQLDRDRPYYFHVYSPGQPFMFTADGQNPYVGEPMEVGNLTIEFDHSSPKMLYYMSPGRPDTVGYIYLNDVRGADLSG